MKKQDLLKMLTGEYGEGRSFRTSTAWVKENDWEVYNYLYNLMIEFVEDETNMIDEEDLEAFENGSWEVEYYFRSWGHDELEFLVTAGRNGHHIAIQSAWIQETYSVEDLDFLNWNWKAYLEQLD